MIGLLILGAGLLWLGLTVYLTIKVPCWLGLQNTTGWLLRLLLVPLPLVAPFVDEIEGMRQFERLCKERVIVHVSSDAGLVKRAKLTSGALVEVPNYWIQIQSQKTDHLDLDTGQPFYTYESLITKGGRIARVALLGGLHSCTAKSIPETSKRLNVEKLLKDGSQS